MLHPPGTRLGPYEIVRLVGEGGMGDVYEARDTRLERTVALKVSKERFGEHFRNEALAVAALNHSHVCALFDVGPDYLVMEFVQGKRLEGPLPLDEALRRAEQIADALEHAHTHGVVHRDLKPSNIFVTKAGVKVLDFGVAKRLSSVGKGEDTSTDAATLMGTPRYMAPEQIEGKEADERTDIFAFGLVLYEMLTGRHAFDGTSAAKVMAAILEKDPAPVSTLNAAVPAALAQVLSTCLAKDPGQRWQSVRELRHALAWASSPIPAPRRPWRRLGLIAASLALAGFAGFVLLRRTAAPARAQPIRLHVALPPRTRLDMMAGPAVSPDGQQIAFALSFPELPPQIFVRPLNALTAMPVSGSEKGSDPFWSPDSRQIAFWAINGNGLKKVDRSGGPVATVCRSCDSGEGGASWGRNDVIIFSTLGRLSRVSALGGEPSPLGTLVPGETGRFWPQFLPDGRHYLYLSLASRREDQGIYVGALDDSTLRRRVVAAEHTAAYSPPGYLLFIKDGVLVAQPFDADRLELSGEPVTVLDEDVARFAGTTTAGRAHFSVSTNGVLGWRPGPIGDVRQLTWFDRSGRKTGTVGEPGVYFGPALSPDEKTVAVCRYESSSNREIWLLDVASGASRRLTFDPHDDCGPIWSPDGAWIAFFSDRRGVRELYRKRADGSGSDELLLASTDFPLNTEEWSADGRFLVYTAPRPGHVHDLFLLPLGPTAEASPIPFLATAAMETAGRLAPSGRWMAYMSNETGALQVYVREVSPQGTPGPGKWQISHERGYTPRWRADGKELFFFERSTPMAVDVKTDGPRFEAGVPKPLGITLGDDVGPFLNAFCVRRDGQQLLFSVPVKRGEPVRVLVNWWPEGTSPER